GRRDGPMDELPDFAAFYAAMFGVLSAQMYAFTGDHAEAEDLSQEAFCRAYARWDRIGRYDDPAAWVIRVAWNLAVSRWRRGRLLRRWHRELAPDPTIGLHTAHIDIVRALARLPSGQRQAVVLHYIADMPVAEIATFMGVAEGTVKAWLHRARATLRAV